MGLSTNAFFLVPFLLLSVSGALLESELEHTRSDKIVSPDKRGQQREDEESLQEVLGALDKREHAYIHGVERGIELCWKCTVDKGSGQDHEVIFKAQTTSDVTLTSGRILVFPKVLQNVGDAYNPNTGIFVAPIEGRYLFATTVLSVPGKMAFIDVIKNTNTELGRFFTGHDTSYSSGGETYALILHKGDQVSVRERGGTTGYVRGDGWSSFMGVLLSAK